jgi:dihydropteroate synthase
MEIFGILNITNDSFSDGGLYLDSNSAIKQANRLVNDGADIIDMGAQASNLEAIQISPEEEWQRIEPVLAELKKKNYRISIDTFKPEVIEKSILSSVEFINNIKAFTSKEEQEVLKKYIPQLPNLILMFSHNQGSKAELNSKLKILTIIDTISDFFDLRLNELIKIGVPEEKLIIDPGMGFFLGEDPLLSIEVLKNILNLKKRFKKVLVSVSRKSFIGSLLGGLTPKEREIGTLALEIYLAENKIDYIRTHNPKQLKQSLKIREYILK